MNDQWSGKTFFILLWRKPDEAKRSSAYPNAPSTALGGVVISRSSLCRGRIIGENTIHVTDTDRTLRTVRAAHAAHALGLPRSQKLGPTGSLKSLLAMR